MSQPHMAMAGMGGPVGGAAALAQPINAGTPGGPANSFSSDGLAKKLNTAIYEYFLCNEKYDIARNILKSDMPIETDAIKQSPGQRGNQANGIDMDVDAKVHPGVAGRPSDLPAPSNLNSDDSSFLQDWWLQFWEMYQGGRHRGRPNTHAYLQQQRQASKARQTMMNGVNGDMQNNMRAYSNAMSNGMDLRHTAMKNSKMTPQNVAQMRNMANANQANQMQSSQMERQGSQMDMNGPRSGSPHNGDAPSPKRQRTDANLSQMNSGRPGQPGQIQANQVGLPNNIPSSLHTLLLSRGFKPEQIQAMSPEQLHKLSAQPTNMQNKSVEVYSQAMQQQLQAAMQKTNSNADKGMPQNNAMGPGGAQSSPMSQPNMDASAGEFFNGTGAGRIGMQNGAAAAAAAQNGQTANGNHALQDYQMQLMLLEQQNKKRLLMARQEQDSMAPGAQGPIQGRGSPAPAMMDPNMGPGMQQRMMMANGQPMMRPPSSHPMGQMTPQQQAEMMRAGQMIPNGNWQGGPQPPQGMMPGQPGQQPGQPPNMTPRTGNMAPPPAPPATNAGTQPSSPAQPPAPPTPSANTKAKAGAKKDTKASKAANKKGASAPAPEENAPPTPTPPPPVTPSAANSFNQNKNLPMTNGATGGQQGNQNNQPPAAAVQPPQPDMNMAPFGALDGTDQFTNMDFANLDSGNVLDTFDFDTFLNNDDGGLGDFDANFAFGDNSIETDGLGN